MPNLAVSNVAREVLLDAKVDPRIPAFSTVMACSTSMMGCDRSRRDARRPASHARARRRMREHEPRPNWTERAAFRLGSKIRASAIDRPKSSAASRKLRPADIGLFIPSVTNRSTGKSMGEHTEETAKAWAGLSRAAQDTVALESHRNAVRRVGSRLFRRSRDSDRKRASRHDSRAQTPRSSSSQDFRPLSIARAASARSPPAMRRRSPTARPESGLHRTRASRSFPSDTPRVRLVDWEIASIDLWNEGLLMAPAYAIPRLLARNGLAYRDIAYGKFTKRLRRRCSRTWPRSRIRRSCATAPV